MIGQRDYLLRGRAMAPNVIRVQAENNDFQYIETLRRNRVKRHRAHEFVVEGVRAINGALAAGWEIAAFLYAPERRLSGWATDILAHSTARAHLELSAPLLAKLSGKEETSELLAVVVMPEERLTRIPLHRNLRVVVIDRPASPGNLGTIIRSCDAFGVDGLIVSGHAVDLYDPETINATTGSLFALPIVRVGGPADLLPWLDRIRHELGTLQIVGTSAKATLDIADHDLTRPTILAVGNETRGLSVAYKELCDAVVAIPIVGSASSLNVACATSVLLYEIDRQRRRGNTAGG
ncbi:MAG: 23S rRNA (uridine(2479)-2'-O)-methyltransferase [uncultured Thermomicrobiales bacterium]|uniref:23S rRNA (Uridine(2479)-2'-O)-methyltransferase n=1 Tax=uncultured Thermomicrobiales bacterium TaxID=1645740 RepID=A0A6J4VM21_9BACT|nr:MAG: 23S rRNA (uridine(2479)-2'-O)-methyltransferase [uncultured Thermomicrobiales bacterium]